MAAKQIISRTVLFLIPLLTLMPDPKSRKQKTKTRKQHGGKITDFNKEAVYKEHIYNPTTFRKLLDYAHQIKDTDMIYDPKASGRAMYVISENDPIIKIICNSELIESVRKITNNPRLKPCLQIPIEYRKYVIGSYMDWHKDTQMLPNQLQYECVITLENTSDSNTLLEYNSGIKTLTTNPNSLLVVRANGISHKVTQLQSGFRTIFKLVFCE